jgi:hypothetical protein
MWMLGVAFVRELADRRGATLAWGVALAVILRGFSSHLNAPLVTPSRSKIHTRALSHPSPIHNTPTVGG